MGGGSWTNASYTTRTTAKLASGKPIFDYSDTAIRTNNFDIHESVDPKRTNKAGAHEGLITRESLDSDEHPDSLPIAVLFDVTGSMREIPQVLQKELPKLYGLVIEKGYVEHPQVLYGAIGDAFSDRVPLQIGQFESDNRADEALENLILEGGGGGTASESYELAAYFLARHTYTDSFEKRGKKGYLFFIGDEKAYPQIDRRHVENLIGDKLQENLSTTEIFKELEEKWEVFYLFATQGSYTAGETLDAGETHGGIGWRKLLGQRALLLEDATDVCETIALTIGLCEGAIDLDEGLDHLAEIGVESEVAGRVGKALATVGGGGAAIAELDGDFGDADEGVDRL